MSDEANSSIPLSDNSEISSTHSHLTNSATTSEKSSSSSVSENGSISATQSEAPSSSVHIIDDSSVSDLKICAVQSLAKSSENNNNNTVPPSSKTTTEPTEQQPEPMDVTEEPAVIEIISETTTENANPKNVEETEKSEEKTNEIKMTDDMYDYMEEAFEEARRALADGEVPIGCVFVYNDQVIARGGNFVNSTKNATRHAEFQCMDQAFDYCTRNSLDYEEVFSKISVFVTVEPCIMCASSLHEFGVKEIIYGCANDRFGGKTVVDVENVFHKNIPILGGIRAQEAMDLLKEFYKGENPSSPMPKNKRD